MVESDVIWLLQCCSSNPLMSHDMVMFFSAGKIKTIFLTSMHCFKTMKGKMIRDCIEDLLKLCKKIISKVKIYANQNPKPFLLTLAGFLNAKRRKKEAEKMNIHYNSIGTKSQSTNH